jgi:histidinol-phosphatase (PHP family)
LHNKIFPFWDTQTAFYVNEITKTLDCIAQSKVIVEINTRGLCTKVINNAGILINKSNETYPSLAILQLMQQRNIPIVINSDSHHPSELLSYFDYAYQLAKQTGYTYRQYWNGVAWLPVLL